MLFSKTKQEPQNEYEEQRGAQRYTVNMKAEYCVLKDEKTGEVIKVGTILNVSKTGLFLATVKPLKLGSVIVMMFDIDWEGIEVPVGVVGTIVREQRNSEANPGEDYYYYGVKFNSPRMLV